jgi:hypothetical protein
VLAGFDIQPVDLDLGAELDAVLLAAGFDDCVHGSLGGDDGEGSPLVARRTGEVGGVRDDSGSSG